MTGGLIQAPLGAAHLRERPSGLSGHQLRRLLVVQRTLYCKMHRSLLVTMWEDPPPVVFSKSHRQEPWARGLHEATLLRTCPSCMCVRSSDCAFVSFVNWLLPPRLADADGSLGMLLAPSAARCIARW